MLVIDVEHLLAWASLPDQPAAASAGGSDSWPAILATLADRGLIDVLERREVVGTIPPRGGITKTSILGEGFDLMFDGSGSGTVPEPPIGAANSADHDPVRDYDLVLREAC